MTRPTIIGGPFPYLSTGPLGGDVEVPPGADPTPSCCDPVTDEEMPDRAQGDTAVALTISTPVAGFIQYGQNEVPSGTTGSVTFSTAITAGSLLVLAVWTRNGATPNLPAGFTQDATYDLTNAGVMLASKTADGTEGTSISIASQGTVARRFVIMEWGGIEAPTTVTSGAAANADPFNVDPGTGIPIGVYAVATDLVGREVNVISPSSIVYEDWCTGDDFGPWGSVGYSTAGDGLDLQATSGAISFHNHRYLVGNYPEVALGDPAWVLPAPQVIDDDDATYIEVATNGLVRIDLGAPFAIARHRIRIDTETAGARVLTIKAASFPDFSDEVTVTTVAFTATGSAQDVTTLTEPTEYRYWELSIDVAEDNRIHAWELYEETPGSSLVTDPTNGDAVAPLQDVLDNLYDAISSPALDDLSDVTITSPAEGDILRYDGAQWVDYSGHYEPVVHDFGSGPELVFDAGDLVMEWFV